MLLGSSEPEELPFTTFNIDNTVLFYYALYVVLQVRVRSARLVKISLSSLELINQDCSPVRLAA